MVLEEPLHGCLSLVQGPGLWLMGSWHLAGLAGSRPGLAPHRINTIVTPQSSVSTQRDFLFCFNEDRVDMAGVKGKEWLHCGMYWSLKCASTLWPAPCVLFSPTRWAFSHFINEETEKRQRRALHNDQRINLRRRYNNYKRIQHRGTSICKANANKYERGN